MSRNRPILYIPRGRRSALVGVGLFASATARADGPVGDGDAPPARPWAPVRVAIDCQSGGRADACTLLDGTLAGLAVVDLVPRAVAQVTLYINVTERANDDLVLLRFVAEISGAPATFEQLVEVDTRLTVDERQQRLDGALFRGLAPFVSVLVPEAVHVELSTPAAPESDGQRRSPWGAEMWLRGSGSWTQDYQYGSALIGGAVYHLTDTRHWSLWANASVELVRQPPLDVDGTLVSLSYNTNVIDGATLLAENLSRHLTVGGIVRGGHQDPEGHYLGTVRAHVGVEYNCFASDDRRGNRLAAAWLIGGQADRYNRPDDLGETRAIFPTHMLLAGGTVRVDRLSLALNLRAQAELLDPARRYVLGADASLTLKVGGHVDLSLALGATQQHVPAAVVDSSVYEEVVRNTFSQPFGISSNLSLRFHWDNTNSARNDRFRTAGDLGGTANL